MNEQQVNKTIEYGSLKEDPISLLKLVDDHVKIDTIKNCSFVGYVQSIDPVTYSIILLGVDGDTCKPTLIPGHGILNVTKVPSQSDIKPHRKPVIADSVEDIMTKKKKLIAWLRTNLLPVTESEDAIVIGNVTVLSPFNISDLCTDNAIVAWQFKKIMESMPIDYNPN